MNNGNNYQQNPYEAAYMDISDKKEPSKGEAVKCMVFGILAAYFAWLPFVSILGIIFGSIAKKAAKRILSAEPANLPTRHMSNAGRITGKIGFIAGIIMTVFWVLYFVFIIAIAGFAALLAAEM